MMDIEYCQGDDGRAFYVKAHVDIGDFKQQLRKEVDESDPILNEEVSHLWMRMCRNFQEEEVMIIEAKPHSRGAFPATWVQDN